MKGLLPEPVSRQEQPLVRLVVERKREHTSQVLNTLNSLFFVEMDNHFGIGLGIKTVSTLFELWPEI